MTERKRTTAEAISDAVKRALGEQGCNYCKQFKPVGQVRRFRTRLGSIRHICDVCRAARQAPTPPTKRK